MLNKAFLNLARNNVRTNANIKLRNLFFQTNDFLQKNQLAQTHTKQKLSLASDIYNIKSNFLENRINNIEENKEKIGSFRNAFS